MPAISRLDAIDKVCNRLRARKSTKSGRSLAAWFVRGMSPCPREEASV